MPSLTLHLCDHDGYLVPDPSTGRGEVVTSQNTTSDLRMVLDALDRTVDALHVLKAIIKTPDEPLTEDQRRRVVKVVNGGYDHGVATLGAFGRSRA